MPRCSEVLRSAEELEVLTQRPLFLQLFLGLFLTPRTYRQVVVVHHSQALPKRNSAEVLKPSRFTFSCPAKSNTSR